MKTFDIIGAVAAWLVAGGLYVNRVESGAEAERGGGAEAAGEASDGEQWLHRRL